jgi:hypothetical protein
MKKLTRLTLLLTIVLAFAGCEVENPYSSYRANIVFDGNIYPYNQARSFGQFICIKQGANIGQYRVTDAIGKTQTVNIPEIHLQQGRFYYGLGGLIIGTPSMGDGTIWAYDWACPDCDLARYRVEIDYTMGHATCPRCATKFDLNSGGIAIEGSLARVLVPGHTFLAAGMEMDFYHIKAYGVFLLRCGPLHLLNKFYAKLFY